MRSLFKGIIGFGLVSIPIQMFKAMNDERVELHYVHGECGTRIKYQKFCPTCQKVLENADLAKGAPMPDGRYVIVPPEDLETGTSDHTVTIVSFHNIEDIDPVYYQQAYWLKAGDGGTKAYQLLAQTMRTTKKVALANMSIRKRQSLAVVRPFGPTALMLHRIYFPESLRVEGQEFGSGPLVTSDKEQKMAAMLIDQMSEPFVPESYPNHARHQLLERLEELMPQAIQPPTSTIPSPSGEVLELMEQLKKSVAQRRTGTS